MKQCPLLATWRTDSSSVWGCHLVSCVSLWGKVCLLICLHCKSESFSLYFPRWFKTNYISHCYFSEIYIYFYHVYMFVSHFKGSVSNICWIIYITIFYRFRWPLYEFFLSFHYCTNGNQTVLTHPQRLTLCVWEVVMHLTDGAVFRLEKNVQLNSTLNWRTLDWLSMYRQHCREFWGWAFDQVNSYTLNVYFFFICCWKLSAWEFKCRLNSYNCIVCWMGLHMT